MTYLLLKWIHILSSTLLFGTGLGSAFYKFFADRTGNIEVIAYTNKNVVLADWLFTTPTVIIQPLTGVLLAMTMGYSLSTSWLTVAIILYLVAGLCWLPVIVIQIKMRNLSLAAKDSGTQLGEDYWRLARLWFYLGIPAFIAMVFVFYLMVYKPLLWS